MNTGQPPHNQTLGDTPSSVPSNGRHFALRLVALDERTRGDIVRGLAVTTFVSRDPIGAGPLRAMPCISAVRVF